MAVGLPGGSPVGPTAIQQPAPAPAPAVSSRQPRHPAQQHEHQHAPGCWRLRLARFGAGFLQHDNFYLLQVQWHSTSVRQVRYALQQSKRMHQARCKDVLSSVQWSPVQAAVSTQVTVTCDALMEEFWDSAVCGASACKPRWPLQYSWQDRVHQRERQSIALLA